MISSAAAAADAQDAVGNHDEAINVLARATAAGDLECMTRLGKRLLVGDRAPTLAQEGARFIADAARAGGAEAAARMAVLLAAGAYFPQSWAHALQLLGLAAERGWVPARAQLEALAPDTAAASEQPRTDDARRWRRMAARVDLRAWLTAPAARDLNADPLVRVYDQFIDAPLCAWLIGHAANRLAPAHVYDPVNRRDITAPDRTNRAATFNLAETEFAQLLLQGRISAACGLPQSHMEAPALLHYSVGQEIINHYDFVKPDLPGYEEELRLNGQRVLTFLVYLNDGYEGGETAFPRIGISHRGRLGSAVYFVNSLADGQPDLRTLHAGRPPTSGEKWIVSQFIRSRPLLGVRPDGLH